MFIASKKEDTRDVARIITIGPELTTLVVKEKNGLVKFPGGRIKQFETPREAILRELEEETGVVVNEERLRDFRSWFSSTYRSYTHFFLADVESYSNLKTLGDDGQVPFVVTFENLLSGNIKGFVPDQARMLKDVVAL